jgi:hypothetical protein
LALLLLLHCWSRPGRQRDCQHPKRQRVLLLLLLLLEKPGLQPL